jgi:Holliday junction resolvasome RuvABC ATP-dependent DNA helicase subunit
MDADIAPTGNNERNFRPRSLADFIGQGDVKKTLGLMLHSASTRKTVLEHVCFYGGPGLGKTTLAAIIAEQQNARFHEVAAPSVQKPGDLASLLVMLQDGDVLFLDEVHALRRETAELLYSAMEDFRVSVKPEGSERPISLGLKTFTLVGATTDYGLLPEPMRARFRAGLLPATLHPGGIAPGHQPRSRQDGLSLRRPGPRRPGRAFARHAACGPAPAAPLRRFGGGR